MLHKSFVLIPIALLATASFIGCSKHGHLHRLHKKGPDMIIKHISKELDLNDVQKEKLKVLVANIQAKHKEMRALNSPDMNKFTEELRKNELDMEMINGLIDQKHTAMQDMRPFILEKLTEFHGMLTPEQRNKLADKMDKFHKEYHQ